MKKLLPLLLTAFLLLTAACAEEVVFPALDWETDHLNHWQLDASGAIINQSEHAIGDVWRCTICNSEVLDWGDSIDVTDYDAYGNVVRCTNYGAEGEMNQQITHVLTYNEDGVVLRDTEYYDGVLIHEAVYTVNENGEQLPVDATTWFDDGTHSINRYDEHGNCVYSASYDVNGVVDCETFSEYAPIEDEWFGLWYYECKTTTRFASGETFYTETNEHGDMIRTLNTYADGTAWSDYSYEYTYKGGDKAQVRTYTQGKLVGEDKYNDEGALIEETEYLEDGGKTVYIYDDNGDLVSSTTYGADGSIITRTEHECIYTEQGNILSSRNVTDGRLTQESSFRYELDEDGEERLVSLVDTVYHEDGTRTETEYDDWMTAIRETTYAADGSILSEELYGDSDEEDAMAEEEELF